MRKTAVAIVLALVLAACGDTTDPVPATDPPGTTAPTTTTAPEPTTTTTPTTTATTAPATTTTTVPPDGPPPFDTWVAIVASLPSADHDRDAAETVAAGFDLVELDVLLSDDYPSLNPGYWVVYSGPVERSWEAARRCYEFDDRAPGCYPRYLGADPREPVGAAHGLALAYTEGEGDLVAISTDTGDVVRTVSEYFYGDGRYPGTPELTADGLAAYYSVGYEDSWFSCDASDGDVQRVDLATGRREQIADGFAPKISPHGDQLLYLAASDCVTDPENQQWVLAALDTLVIRDLSTGRETRTVFPTPPDTGDGPYELWSAVWSRPDGDSAYVLDTAGTVWRSLGPNREPQAVARLGDGGWHWRLVAFDEADATLLAARIEWVDDTATTELHRIDPATGTVELVAEYPGRAAFSVSAAGRLAVATPGTIDFGGRQVATDATVIEIAW